MHVENYLKKIRHRKEGEDYWIKAGKNKFIVILKNMKSRGVGRLSSITGNDIDEHIEVIYHLIHENRTINIKVEVSKKKCEIGTVTNIYPGAELFERELYEMLGIKVIGHPNLKKLFLDEKSPKNPLRKD